MEVNDQELIEELRVIFRDEAAEHLQTLSARLMDLEKAETPAQRSEIATSMCHTAHSLKGAARAVNEHDVERVCQALEASLATVRQDGRGLSPEEFDDLHRGLDLMHEMLTSPSQDACRRGLQIAEALTSRGVSTSPRPLVQRKGPRSTRAEPPEPSGATAPQTPRGEPPASPEPAAAKSGSPPHASSSNRQAVGGPVVRAVPAEETLRISAAKLDALLRESEELLTIKQAALQRLEDLNELLEMCAVWEREWSRIEPKIRLSRERWGLLPDATPQLPMRDKDGGIAEFVHWNAAYVGEIRGRLELLKKLLSQDLHNSTAMIDTLLEDAKQVLMLPCSTVLRSLPKIARDLSRDQEKQVELELRGEQLEIDKRVLDEIRDPLIHLLRNCIDHGVEAPEERKRLGKPPAGRIVVGISRTYSNQVEVIVSDDGRGIDTEGVAAACVREGLLNAHELKDCSRDKILAMIFHSGLTTSPMITDISGRGLGLAIVHEKVHRLGGQALVTSESGLGTTFRLILPLTVARFRGLLVEASGWQFIVPTSSVRRVVRLTSDKIKKVGEWPLITKDGRAIACLRLDEALGIAQEASEDAPHRLPVGLVLEAGGRQVVFAVDRVLSEREVLLKGLGKQLVRVACVAGATVLGSGRIVPVLNIPELMSLADRKPVAGTSPPSRRRAEPTGRKSILVVEDSITSRTLLKNILRSAGYEVQTAVDGVAAITALRTGEFNLVVSDLEMPRMDGFELTSTIRKDERLADLPVVLVTSRSAKEDRERGVEAGANAYLVKSSFDQSNLLDAVERLL